jgi:selenocysteine lyase/cysteine desulfurase
MFSARFNPGLRNSVSGSTALTAQEGIHTGGGCDWTAFRSQMPVARRWAYFDHAAVAPLSGPAQRALARWADDAVLHGDAYYSAWKQEVDQTRRRAARLIGAQSEEIALVANTTAGVNLVAEGFPWRSGDNVVVPANEFPTNLYPWMQLAGQGVETRRVEAEDGRMPVERLSAACDSRTRIVSVSWVSYSSGWRQDLDSLAEAVHQRGALLFLDAIQALGVFPLDVRRTPIDFLAADGHKWLLGPEGAGIFFLRREHLQRLRPLGIGWNSVVHAHDFSRIELTLRDTAMRYEGGSWNVAGLTALGASLELLEQFGAEAISRRVLEVTELACRRLQEIGAVLCSDRREPHASGIVAFELPGCDLAAARQACLQRQVVLSCRAGRLRISPHAYNHASDVERLIDALESIRTKTP